mmetsp:Transcript_14143/g.37337  ORF Transcript_14143/g.37337 Transcript_14143/m.37337 type:complete len:247 (-) Transcript_14143:248-988(-)
MYTSSGRGSHPGSISASAPPAAPATLTDDSALGGWIGNGSAPVDDGALAFALNATAAALNTTGELGESLAPARHIGHHAMAAGLHIATTLGTNPAAGQTSTVIPLLFTLVLVQRLIASLPDTPRWLTIQRSRLAHFSPTLDHGNEARLLAAAIAQEKFDEKNDVVRVRRERLLGWLCSAPRAIAQPCGHHHERLREEPKQPDPEAGYYVTPADTDDANYASSEEQSRALKLGTVVASMCACLVELV